LTQKLTSRAFGVPLWSWLALALILVSGLELRVSENLKVDGFDVELRPSDTPHHISCAENLRYGVGYMDMDAVLRFNENPANYRARPADHPERLTWYSWNDPGLSLIYATAIVVFGNCASPPLLLLWLQIVADAVNIVLIFMVGRCIRGDAMGLIAAFIYASFWQMANLAGTHPYYYFWTSTLALWNLVLLDWISRDRVAEQPLLGRLWRGVLYGLFIGFCTLVRPTFAPLGLLGAIFLGVRQRSRWRAALPVALAIGATQALVLLPFAVRSYQQFGQPRPPRPMHHTMFLGFGGHPNPYGIIFDDKFAGDYAEKHGGFRADDPQWSAKYERFLAGEVARIKREHPWLWPRNTVVNIYNGLTFTHATPNLKVMLGQWTGQLTLPVAPVIFGLLLLLVLFRVIAPRTEGRWLFAIVLLQLLYFVGVISLILPPFFNYNTAAMPTFCVALAGAVLGLYELGHVLRRAVARADFGKVPLVDALLKLAALDAAYLCWTAGVERDETTFLAGLAGVLLVGPAAVLLASVLRAANLSAAAAWAATLTLALGALSFLFGGSRVGTGWSATLSPLVYPQVVLGAGGLLMVLRSSTPWMAAIVAPLATRFHAEACALPAALLLLLRPEAFSPEVRKRLARFGAGAVLTGGAVTMLAAALGLPFKFAYLSPIVLCAAVPAAALSAPFRKTIVAALLFVRFGGLPAWPVVGAILIVSVVLAARFETEVSAGAG